MVKPKKFGAQILQIPEIFTSNLPLPPYSKLPLLQPLPTCLLWGHALPRHCFVIKFCALVPSQQLWCGKIFSQVTCFRGNHSKTWWLIILSEFWTLSRRIDHFVRFFTRLGILRICQPQVCEDICFEKCATKCCTSVCLSSAMCMKRNSYVTECANNVTWRPIAKLCVYLVRTDFFEKLSM